MRKAILITTVVVVAWIAWLAWPLTALYALVRSVEARNAPAIYEQLDPAAIRHSLMDQVLAATSRVAGSPLARNSLIAAIAGSIADPLLAAIITPDGLALLLQIGWVSPELAERPIDAQGLSSRSLGDARQVFLNSEFRLDRYSVSFPADQPATQRFELQWRMRGLKWRLTAIRLPNRLVDRLAERIAKVQR